MRVAWTGRLVLVCACSVRQTIGWRGVWINRQTDVCVWGQASVCVTDKMDIVGKKG